MIQRPHRRWTAVCPAHPRPWTRSALLAFVTVLFLQAGRAQAQDHQHGATSPSPAGWTWTWQASASVNLNIQERKFTDFRQMESQNWFMAGGDRALGRSTVRLHAMASLEPFTLRRLGSAQVFQTGETLDGAPLIDYQHPHDLFMTLEGTLEHPVWESARVFVSAAPVGAATFGPPAFMHRASALGNTTAPLTHHHLDSTHISRSVIATGIAFPRGTLELSVFKGREPDEDRLDVDLGAPDSAALRWSWRQAGWAGQVSIARRRQPEVLDPHDVTAATASLERTTTWLGRPLTWLLAVGRHADPLDRSAGFLVEGTWQTAARSLVYARGEIAGKNILTAGGLHPPGAEHEHTISTIGALTVGVERSLAVTRAGHFAIGGDVTVHAVPAALLDSYGHPVSMHIGLRYRRP